MTATNGTPMTTTTTGRRRPALLADGFSVGRLLLQGRAFFALVAIIVVFSILSPNYFTLSNILTMSSHVAVYAILAIGMLVVILNGGIDLSVGSTLGFSGVIAGALMKGVAIGGVTLYPKVWVVVVISCAAGALIGFVNGILVARFKVAPFVATLGMLYVVRGIGLTRTGGRGGH